MKKLNLVLLSTVLLLAACGGESNETIPAEQEAPTTVATEEVVEDVETDESSEAVDSAEADEEGAEDAGPTGDWEEADFGKIKAVGFGYNDELGIDGTDAPLKPLEMGPMLLEIGMLAVVDIQPDEDSKELFFDDKSETRAVIIDMKVENTSEADVTFDPNMAVIVTNTGEQLEPDMFLTDSFGGDFLGKVKKEGQIWWILNDIEQEVTSVKLIISPPYNTDDWEDLGEEKRLEFEVLNYEESMKRDQ